MEKQNVTLSDALKRLEGQKVNSVDFVEDYVQIHFDRGCLTAYTLPKIDRDGDQIEDRSPAYKESLYKFQGNELQRIDLQLGRNVILSFPGACFSISPRDEDHCGPEAL